MKLAVLGSGLMGKAIAYHLSHEKDVEEILLADKDIKKAESVSQWIGSTKVKPIPFNATDGKSVVNIMKRVNVAIGATSYTHNINFTKWAIDSGCSFIDLGGNHWVVDEQFSMDQKAKEAGVIIIPDCGLAPGLVNVLVGRAVKGMDSVKYVKIRVGGVPQDPIPPLNYSLFFSVEGLFNEYIEKSRIIEEGTVKEVESLEGLEEIYFPSPFGKMEAFYTSGGTSTMIKSLKNKVRNLNYKTIRYPSHQKYMKFLKDMGFMSKEKISVNGTVVSPRSLSEKLFSKHLPINQKDAVLVRVEVEGKKNGESIKYTQQIIDHYDQERNLTAMMRTTAFPASVTALMIARGSITEKGVLYQEISIPHQEYIKELEKWNIFVEENYSNTPKALLKS